MRRASSKDFLETEGIPAQIENVKFSMEPINFGTMGDIRIYVGTENEVQAQQLLRQRTPTSTGWKMMTTPSSPTREPPRSPRTKRSSGGEMTEEPRLPASSDIETPLDAALGPHGHRCGARGHGRARCLHGIRYRTPTVANGVAKPRPPARSVTGGAGPPASRSRAPR